MPFLLGLYVNPVIKCSLVFLFSCLHCEVNIITENTPAVAFSHPVNECVNYAIVLPAEAVCPKINFECFFSPTTFVFKFFPPLWYVLLA